MSQHSQDTILSNDIQYIKEIVIRIEKHLEKLNDRTRKLEIWRGWFIGSMTVISAVVSFVIYFVERRL